jgi:ribosomal-protein-alanine N-acetyltransferase
VIEPMTAGHIAEIMRVEREMFGTEAWTSSAYREELRDTRNRHYVVDVEDGRVTGWAGLLVLGDQAEILTVGVVPDARRRGIARRLVADLLEHARSRGAGEVFLEVRVDNEPARTLYRSERFADVGLRRGYYENGRVDAVVMRREL